MNFIDNLNLHIRARYSIIYIQSFEEERLEKDIVEMAEKMKPIRNVKVWDFVNGFNGSNEAKQNPMTALDMIFKDKNTTSIYILKDFHKFLDDVGINRAIRNISNHFKYERKTIIIISPQVKIPNDLEEDIVILDYNLPKYEEIFEYTKNLTKDTKVDMDDSSYEMLVKAFQGLTLNKIRLIMSKAIAKKGILTEDDIELVLEEKKQIIKRTEVLDFYPTTENIEDIGGLVLLKNWIKTRGLAFSQKAREYGLPYPKGILLIGIQGTGKSLSSKAIARQWKMPLIKLDIGRLMGSLVGESESRTSQMIRTAEAMAPCILWIDEIDKGFAGVNGYQGDSGTLSRVLGTIITWMQEKNSPVFIVATANNIESLPPELLRKGRFDEIFFVDLPSFKERKEIFELHLKKKRGYDVRRFNMELLANKSHGFSGAEIEQIIIDGMFQAFSEEREFITEDVLNSIENTVPLSRTSKEKIEKLIQWAASGRARYASYNDNEVGQNKEYSLQDIDLPN